ncbi:lactase-like protein isoform 2-T3 [Glossophaga mutica]
MKPVPAVTLWWVLLLVSRLGAARKGSPEEASFYYGTFPLGFSWGVGSSAFQTEGAWDEEGKGPSIWDAFTHSGKGKVLGDETADVACNSYYKVQEDIILLRELHVNHYRFSLSWPRLLPTGVRGDHVNEKGIKFYSDFIDALLKSNITPIVTLHHWDLPQLLQVKYGGWQNVSMTSYFNDYAELCFEAFGDRVKHWVTFSDPRTMAEKGYETGQHAPGLKLHGTGLYKAAHHIIKAHAQAWHSYNNTWRSKQRGLVGISLNCEWGEPVDINNPKDIEAAERYLQFCLGWFANPIYAGDYPQVMKERIAIKDGANIKGYTSWSLLDKFEWEKGYSDRYGFYYVEFKNRNKPRYPKASVQYYKKIIAANGFPNPREVESWYFKALETCSINNQMLAAEPLLSHMQMATEIVVPTVCTLCVLIAAVLLMLLLRSRS